MPPPATRRAHQLDVALVRGQRCVDIVYADSVTAVSAGRLPLLGPSELCRRFPQEPEPDRAPRLRPADHAAPGASDLVDRLEGKAPLDRARPVPRPMPPNGAKALDERLAKEAAGQVSWRVTLPCTRAQAEALPDADELLPASADPPVLVADEPDPSRPDDWLLHAYFDRVPTRRGDGRAGRARQRRSQGSRSSARTIG